MLEILYFYYFTYIYLFLAFNLRGFPPLEPAMGGIEPCTASATDSIR